MQVTLQRTVQTPEAFSEAAEEEEANRYKNKQNDECFPGKIGTLKWTADLLPWLPRQRCNMWAQVRQCDLLSHTLHDLPVRQSHIPNMTIQQRASQAPGNSTVWCWWASWPVWHGRWHRDSSAVSPRCPSTAEPGGTWLCSLQVNGPHANFSSCNTLAIHS